MPPMVYNGGNPQLKTDNSVKNLPIITVEIPHQSKFFFGKSLGIFVSEVIAKILTDWAEVIMTLIFMA